MRICNSLLAPAMPPAPLPPLPCKVAAPLAASLFVHLATLRCQVLWPYVRKRHDLSHLKPDEPSSLSIHVAEKGTGGFQAGPREVGCQCAVPVWVSCQHAGQSCAHQHRMNLCISPSECSTLRTFPMQDDKYTARHTNVSKVSSGCQSHVILMGSIETMLIKHFQLLETADGDASKASKASSNQVKQHVNHVAVCSCLKAQDVVKASSVARGLANAVCLSPAYQDNRSAQASQERLQNFGWVVKAGCRAKGVAHGS